ncbi:MAG TPA: transketolase family protein, partial [Candidatus Tectomicrobia bacterium]
MIAATAVQTNDWRTKAANQTRLAYGQALLEVAARDPKAVVLSADTQDLLGIRPYMALYPERFVEVGIAEQNTIGIASGLATTGLHAYVCGYAPFIG